MSEEKSKVWNMLVPGDKIWLAAPVVNDNQVSSNFQECSVIQSKPVVNRYNNKFAYWFIKFKYTAPDGHRQRAYLNISESLSKITGIQRINGHYEHRGIKFGDIIVSVSLEHLKMQYNQLIIEALQQNDIELSRLEHRRDLLRKAYITNVKITKTKDYE